MSKQRIAVIDSETNPFEHGADIEPFVWGYYDGDEYHEFWGDGEEGTILLVEFLHSIEKDTRIYAHNGGKFDFFFLLPFLDENIKVINGRIARCKIGKCTLVDSYLILPMPLSAYNKDEFNYDLCLPENRYQKKNVKKISDYLYKDCFYLFEWVNKFIDRFGIHLTLPTAAYKELKSFDYPLEKITEAQDDFFRPFYFGGRVECPQGAGVFSGDFAYYDINSAYPYAMMRTHPVGEKFATHRNINELKGHDFINFIGVSKNVLPVRTDDGLQYPNDNKQREYHATGHEVLLGLEMGLIRIQKVKAIYSFNVCCNFSEFVNEFYTQKQNAPDKTARNFAKLILNSSYGKFAIDPRKFKDYKIGEVGDFPDDFIEIYRDSSGYSIAEKPAPSDFFNNVATAASITGFVRAYLYSHILTGSNVIYCDTDSVICENFGGEIHPDKLGAWDIEHKIKEKVYIAGKKVYCFTNELNEEIYRSKGARLSFGEIKRMVESGDVITWKNNAPSFSLRYGCRYIERDIQITG